MTSVAVTWIAVWNNGKIAIAKSDLSSHNPLRIISTRNARILSAEVVGRSDPGNHPLVAVDRDGKTAQISFEYLNYRHGCMVSVIHTGTTTRFLSIAGDVINGTPPRQVDSTLTNIKSIPTFASAGRPQRTSLFATKGIVIAAVLALTLIVLGVGFLVGWDQAINAAFSGTIVPIAIFAAFLAFFGDRVARRGMQFPVGLDELHDDRLSPEFWDREAEANRPILF